jgi:hypothetical protein
MKAQKFKQFINENEDQSQIEDRLRDLGLAPKEEFDDRWDNMVDEWGSDPEISRAIDVLKSRTSAIMNKYIDYSDPEDEANYDQRREWIWEASIDDIGFLEFMIAQGDV